mgnify:CR=1 FL=1|jgi:hypothetical protein|tara:strand:- start:6090 stop:6347 length:258 start_codon:yes stop_codon:yes gene_type:complete
MAQSPRYTPNPAPSSPEDLPKYIFEELLKLQGALEENPTKFIEVTNVTPARKKPGDLVYADGTNFNPGGGEGIYFVNAAGSYTKL